MTIALIVLNVLVAAAGPTDPGHEAVSLPGAAALHSVFVHAGWIPAGASMLCLWIFGDNIEDAMGRGPFLLFYLMTGILGVATYAASSPGAGTLVPAASAPVAAVMLAYFVLYPRSRVLTIVFLVLHRDVIEIPAVFLAGFWVLIHVVAGTAAIAQGLSSAAAFGPPFAGGAAGALAGLLLRRRMRWARWA